MLGGATHVVNSASVTLYAGETYVLKLDPLYMNSL